jgi:antitoxin ParD1/3/4
MPNLALHPPIVLSPQLESFVRQQIDSGHYSDFDEMVRTGLQLLESYESKQEAKLQALREAVAIGLASGPDLTEAEVFDELEAELQALADETE